MSNSQTQTSPARHRVMAAAAACVVLLTAACGHRSRPAERTKTTPTVAASSASGTSSASATTTSSDPLAAAATIFAAWSQRTLDYETWWSRLKPMLSPAGQAAYAGTDPSAIPDLRVTGPYRLDPTPPDDPSTSALVHVATDRGTFGLFLVRSAPGAPWRLLQIVFPAGIH